MLTCFSNLVGRTQRGGIGGILSYFFSLDCEQLHKHTNDTLLQKSGCFYEDM